jgi:hypothetical protein
VLAATTAVNAALPMWINFSDAELQRDKRAALEAMNSPEVWRRFPKQQHERHYTPVLREISFSFYPPEVNKVTVIIPTTHIGPRHKALIYVTFDHAGKILEMSEVPEI